MARVIDVIVIGGHGQVALSLARVLTAQRLWVNPDCGLKTRKTDE